MSGCSECVMSALCLRDDVFRRGRPFILFYARDGTLWRCALLENESKREKYLGSSITDLCLKSDRRVEAVLFLDTHYHRR